MDDQARRQRFEQTAPALIGDVRRYLARRTDPATAEDVLAETLLVCWRRIDDLPDPPRPVEAAEPADPGVAQALAALRPAVAEVLRLWAWEDLGPTEIAEVLSISVNAANLRLHRARQRLREQLGKSQQASGHIEATEGSRP